MPSLTAAQIILDLVRGFSAHCYDHHNDNQNCIFRIINKPNQFRAFQLWIDLSGISAKQFQCDQKSYTTCANTKIVPVCLASKYLLENSVDFVDNSPTTAFDAK